MTDQYIASLSKEDWERIAFALKSYIITEEWSLSQENHGDKEWQELNVFETLLKDIELYVIGAEQ